MGRERVEMKKDEDRRRNNKCHKGCRVQTMKEEGNGKEIQSHGKEKKGKEGKQILTRWPASRIANRKAVGMKRLLKRTRIWKGKCGKLKVARVGRVAGCG